MISLNIGCGESKLDGFINVDCIENDVVKPDLILDITKQKLPYENGSVEEIWMIHSLEHIEMYKWEFIIEEFVRVLKDNGSIVLSYPEFSECAKRFVGDTGGKKNFWRATLYGRQLYPSDYHVTPMDSNEIKGILENAGFYRINWKPESDYAPYNSIIVGYKNPEHITREAVLVKELRLEVSENWTVGDKI